MLAVILWRRQLVELRVVLLNRCQYCHWQSCNSMCILAHDGHLSKTIHVSPTVSFYAYLSLSTASHYDCQTLEYALSPEYSQDLSLHVIPLS